MEVVRVIDEAHESEIVSLAYNRIRREIYSAADGDKVIKVWDSRTGQLIRTQQGHKGMVTSLNFSSTVRLLFSGSIDSTVGIWTEKGVNLQMTGTGGPVHAIAWDERRRYLIVGGNSVIHIFKVDLAEARKTSQQQRSVASGLKDTNALAEAPAILKRMYQPLKGPDLCHVDVVKCIVVTDTGKIISGGFDKNICIYEFDKLDKPKEAFQRIRKCHTAAIVSMAYDTSSNSILTGSIDGGMKVWSMEGRLLDKFENINDQPVCVSYVPSTNMYWASGRFGRLVAFDPRAPANVTEYVKESNGLDRFKVQHMFAPLGTDLLLGTTKQRQLVIWQYNQMGAYRMFTKHEDWAEALVVVPTTINDQPCDEIYSAGADGVVLRWQLDAEQNCDIYECIEEIPMHDKNIYTIVYSPALNCLITGGEDATIQFYYLSGEVPTYNDVPLPTSFQDHEARVSGLALLKNRLMASISYDKTIRIWDLTTMKPVHVVQDAHDTPLQCIEYCAERDELATCAMGNKVRVWDVRKPAAIKLKLVLDHSDGDQGDDDEDSRGYRAKTNMQWLTRSDLTGLPKANNPLVEETIRKAHRDVPEVTQVRWVSYRSCWVTAADDDMIRLWGPDGVKLHQFTYQGGSVQCLYVDEVNQLLVTAMLDKSAYVYDLDDPIPRAEYKGHQDVVRAVGYLKESNCYVTASWDKSLRLWYRPSADRGATAADARAAAAAELQLLDEEQDEEHFQSNYEKAHPLEMPAALKEANQWQVLKAIGVLEDDKGGRKKSRALREMMAAEFSPETLPDPPGSLGAALDDLGKELLAEINALSRKAAGGTSGAAAGGQDTARTGARGRPSRVGGAAMGRR